jgi:hypothetical protein
MLSLTENSTEKEVICVRIMEKISLTVLNFEDPQVRDNVSSAATSPVVFRASRKITHTALVSSNITVNELCRMAAAVIGTADNAPPSKAAESACAQRLVLTSEGRVLGRGDATLADACRSSGATVEVWLTLAGGMQGDQAGSGQPLVRRSVSRDGIEAMLRELAPTAESPKAARPTTSDGARLPSHALRLILQRSAQEAAPGPFRPPRELAQHYLEAEPDVALTHAWDVCLLTELPRFLDAIERELLPELGRAPRYWLAVLFPNEADGEPAARVAAAEERCVGAAYHYVLMRGGPLSRAWCGFEAAARVWAAMRKTGLAQPEDVVPHVVARHPAFPRLVVVEGLTLGRDVGGGREYDKFGTMAAQDPEEREAIRARIAEGHRSPAEFNMVMSALRAAAIQSVCKVRGAGECAR